MPSPIRWWQPTVIPDDQFARRDGWGVGGIEAASAILGEPISMVIPEVVGCRLVGRLRPGVTSTDLVLTVTQRLRAQGVIGKWSSSMGLACVSCACRAATLSNMSPEYGATMAYFPIDQETLRYLQLTGRDPRDIALAEAYAKAQDCGEVTAATPFFSDTLEIDLGEVEASAAGPRRPQDRHALRACRRASRRDSDCEVRRTRCSGQPTGAARWRRRDRRDHELHQHVEPLGADGCGLLARNASAWACGPSRG